MTICVFCAASRRCHPDYVRHAEALGRLMATRGHTMVTGGGSTGLMGAVADSALNNGGRVVGVMPKFMHSVEVAHGRLSDMRLVESMSERLDTMLSISDAFIALPGGCGTLEEILLVVTRKRLGRHGGPLIMVNTRRYFDHLAGALHAAIDEGFMDARHGAMWALADDPSSALDLAERTPPWPAENARFAVPGAQQAARPAHRPVPPESGPDAPA